jgi:hypothetical protein
LLLGVPVSMATMDKPEIPQSTQILPLGRLDMHAHPTTKNRPEVKVDADVPAVLRPCAGIHNMAPNATTNKVYHCVHAAKM